MTFKEHYHAAHRKWFERKYPTAVESGFYCLPKFPAVGKANGLTAFVVNFLEWSGYYANRISSAGRWIEDKQQFIRGNTRKGTADIHAIIKGHHVSIEVKVGKDKMSEHQHKEKARIEAAGGKYWIVKTPDDFITEYLKL